ncbi:hypothetical protein H696_04331 [Fonticula alba]|uniref:Peptidase S26 domain-containing protein n=1 Tax=Fonticula alba TaxID=691883 RepID=A0A058Z5W9_FONAL|nr:hypothetical protein H696_04331 [Fonticula alba]KCV68912.1 hypothetical protein H696_04331 [Fonticula alba]|eukprot:XP_009496483.1 hypothetical protein H696_04331 [Fonticula alba]
MWSTRTLQGLLNQVGPNCPGAVPSRRQHDPPRCPFSHPSSAAPRPSLLHLLPLSPALSPPSLSVPHPPCPGTTAVLSFVSFSPPASPPPPMLRKVSQPLGKYLFSSLLAGLFTLYVADNVAYVTLARDDALAPDIRRGDVVLVRRCGPFDLRRGDVVALRADLAPGRRERLLTGELSGVSFRRVIGLGGDLVSTRPEAFGVSAPSIGMPRAMDPLESHRQAALEASMREASLLEATPGPPGDMVSSDGDPSLATSSMPLGAVPPAGAPGVSPGPADPPAKAGTSPAEAAPAPAPGPEHIANHNGGFFEVTPFILLQNNFAWVELPDVAARYPHLSPGTTVPGIHPILLGGVPAARHGVLPASEQMPAGDASALLGRLAAGGAAPTQGLFASGVLLRAGATANGAGSGAYAYYAGLVPKFPLSYFPPASCRDRFRCSCTPEPPDQGRPPAGPGGTGAPPSIARPADQAPLDSSNVGPVSMSLIDGRAVARLWPPARATHGPAAWWQQVAGSHGWPAMADSGSMPRGAAAPESLWPRSFARRPRCPCALVPIRTAANDPVVSAYVWWRVVAPATFSNGRVLYV